MVSHHAAAASQHLVPQPSDYESDMPGYYNNSQAQFQSTSGPSPIPATQPQTPAPQRTNEELNLAVLRRHNPAVTSILSLAQYAVVYFFNATTQLWEKIGIEGTLFVCLLTQGELGEERYNAFVLNRRGMENFEVRLSDGDDIEITDEYVILKVDEQAGDTPAGNSGGNNNSSNNNGNGARRGGQTNKPTIYGLWIFSEPAPSSTADARSLNARVIKECAVHGGESKKLAQQRLAAEQSQNASHNYSHADAAQGGVPMGRQISLKELFGQQRAQDDEWSVKVHSPMAVPETNTTFPFLQQQQQQQKNPAPQQQAPFAPGYQQPGTQGIPAQGGDIFELLRRAAER